MAHIFHTRMDEILETIGFLKNYPNELTQILGNRNPTPNSQDTIRIKQKLLGLPYSNLVLNYT